MGMERDERSPWMRLRAVLAPERRELWVVLIYGIAVSALSMVVPVAAQALVSSAAFGTLLQPIVVLSILVLGFLVLSGGLRLLQVVVAERIQQRLFARMSIDVAYRLPRARLETYDRHRGTELVNRFFDVFTIQKSTALILLDGLALVLQAVVGLVLLGLYHPALLGFDVVMLAGIALVLFGFGRGAVKTSVAESYAKYEVVAWLEEVARNPIAFRLGGGSGHALREADRATVNYLEHRKAHFRILLRQIAGTYALQALVASALLGLGGWLVVQEQLSLGQLVAAELIVTPVAASFAKFGKYLETTYDLLAAVDKVSHLFDLPLERTGPPRVGDAPPPRAPIAVRARGVVFGFSESAPLTSGIDLEIAAGERLALLGGSGQGKSTLVDVLLGIRQPHRGAVQLDGLTAEETPLEPMRERIALVRGIELFEGTIGDNVRVGRGWVTPTDVREALEAVGLLDEVMRLPGGTQARISGLHAPLSTGQAERLMLARALAGKPGLLVIDEGLDALDEDRALTLLDMLLRAGAPWTLLVVTDRPAIAERFSRTLRLGEGRLEEVRR